MNVASRQRRSVTPAWLCLALVACGLGGVGDGSEIGPVLPDQPDDSCKVVVLDDAGRGVTAATVRVGSARARTGRNGRGDLFASPRGRVLVQVDAEHGAAIAGDVLGGYTVAVTVVGPDLPAVLHVPELPDSASQQLDAGTQSATVTLTTPAGSVVTLPAGGSLGLPSGAVSVVLRTGDLQAANLPGDLPADPAGALLFGHAVVVAPASATFTPGLSLEVADDLDAGTTAPRLFRLDATTGEWGEVAATTAAVGGRLSATAAAGTGGLYAFALPVAATTVSGRILDVAGNAVSNAIVRCDQRVTRSGGDGRFSIEGLAATTASGAPRAAALAVFAGGSWLPARSTIDIAVGTAPTAIGDITLDTLPAGDIRVQQIVRGRANSFAPARISSQNGDVALATTSNADGQAFFEDVPAEFFGFQDGVPLSGTELLQGQSVAFLDRGRRRLDALQFQQRRAWFQGARRTRAYVSDAAGGGPLAKAFVINGAVPGQGLVAETQDGATVFAARDFAGRATVTRRSQRDGASRVDGFTIVEPNGDVLELPLPRLLRRPLGAFDRHGLVGGALVGADPARRHALRSTRRLSLQEWWDEVVDGTPIRSALPLDLDPAITHDEFVVGVDAIGGNLAAIEFTQAGGIDTLQALGIAADVAPTEGARTELALPLSAPATGVFVAGNALVGLAPEIDIASLRFDLALRQPSGRVIDVARGLGGNVTANGLDLRFTLPELSGPFAGHEWLALLKSSSAAGGLAASHASLCVLRTQAPPSFRLPAFPAIVAPAAAATVAATGFAVDFTLPAGAVHGTIELSSPTGGEPLSWRVVVPPDATRFEFVTLPATAPSPLVPGRTYTLTVSAFFGAGVLATSSDAYRDLTTFWQSIGAAERGVVHVARRSIVISTP